MNTLIEKQFSLNIKDYNKAINEDKLVVCNKCEKGVFFHEARFNEEVFKYKNATIEGKGYYICDECNKPKKK